MNVTEIYQKYSIPQNLQNHMLLVARVSSLICKFIKGHEINASFLVKAALVHDLGNLVKFDLEKYPYYMGKEQKNIAYWKEKQQEIIKKYGSDDHLATKKMLEELHLPPAIISLIEIKSFDHAVQIKDDSNWELKILLYADLRLAPTGIVPLKDRLEEVMKRLPKYHDRPDLAEAAYQIEDQIQKDCELPLDKLTYNVLPDVQEFLHINF